MADGPKDLEEHFVLRIQDEALADKLRRILREQLTLDGFAELSFQGGALWNADAAGSSWAPAHCAGRNGSGLHAQCR